MKSVFIYDYNEDFLTKDLKVGYTDNNFSFLDVPLSEKGPSVKI